MSYIPNRDFLIEVAKGNITGHSIVHKFGRNTDVDTGSSAVDIWSPDGVMTWQTSADVLDVTSTSTNDDGNPTTNTGAQTLTITGLDASFDVLEETITLDGTSTVTTSGSFIRVYRMFVATTGTYHNSNLGTLHAQYQTSTNTAADIEIGVGQTEMTHYTVPNAKTAYLLSAVVHVQGSVGANDAEVDFIFRQNPNADDVSQPFGGAYRTVLNLPGIKGSFQFTPRAPISFAGKTDLWWEANNSGVDNTSVAVDYELLLVDN